MFSLVSRLVIGRPWVIVLFWLILAGSLRGIAPSWDQVTQDDNVRFFPPHFPSVIGQDLLERGFPQDASSSQVVLVYRRNDSPLEHADFTYVEKVAASFYQFARSHPALGFKKLDTHRSPVIGPRLIGRGAEGRGQAVL